MRAGQIVATNRIGNTASNYQGESAHHPENELWAAVLEHERVPVITYPHEWSFTMLQDGMKVEYVYRDYSPSRRVVVVMRQLPASAVVPEH